MPDFTPIIVEFLDDLESREARLLSWGLVDGSFEEDEIAGLAESFLNDRQQWDNFPDPMDLVDILLDRRLLFAFIQGSRTRYRTRMAEAVRLISRLRQWFPGKPWQLAPTLVADYRLARVPRRYPRREVIPDVVLARLEVDNVRLTRLQRDGLLALLRVGQRDELQLAEFQFQAILRMLRNLASRKSRGLIIGAGTGTGKTLAFYIPALTHLAGLVEPNEHWTKVVAVYPRNELLKDQFSETYTEARRLDPVLIQQGKRKIAIGAFFVLTPRNAAELKRDAKWGRPRAGGYVCPYLRCPRCDGDLVWRIVDLDRGEEKLHCLKAGCASVVHQDEVMLTRERMKTTPPDVFFSTTEMLNRRMSDKEYGHLFGIGPSVRRRPQLMLLDEVHTYVGTSGAQVALLLRRWQRALGSIVQFTGLSATLRGATNFFEQLLGLRPGAVEEVSPRESELDVSPESVEYVMAVRGDPVSATSLLSTSIQVAVLLGRILDPRQSNPSQGIYGKRLFAFTDDLDVTNRFYNNLQDAEGLDSWSQPLQPAKAPLASLRSPSAATDNAQRFIAGQSWQMCEDIGHPIGLAQPLQISRTSSQDVGVAQSSNIVVATAALEVGYNDPEVGAVMQHKAPRDLAAFVQRKGRAGRRRTMRPWTIVTLSDYGRDRVAYQAYDQFFSPELPVRSLPVSNRYVLRMQAAYALMDWVARELPQQAPSGSVWRDFSGPSDTDWTNNMKARQNLEAEILKAALDCNSDRSRSLAQYIQSALGLTVDETLSILWDAPRPLMLSIIPTILRRLESGWRRVQSHPDEPTRDHLIADHPLPDFVPQQLFGDLNLPEVEITLDLQGRLARFKVTNKTINSLANEGVDESVLSKIAALNDEAFLAQEHFLTAIGKVLGSAELRRYQDLVLTHAEKESESEFLPIVQALKTLTPGRVTRRFGHRHRFANHWFPLPNLQDHNQFIPVEQYCSEFEEAGNFQIREGVDVRDVRCLRPWKIHPRQPPANVAVTSNSVLEWRSQIAPSREDDRLRFEPPRGIGWDELLDEIRFFTHHQRNHAVVRRFAVGARANVSFRDGTELDAVVRFVNQSDGAPAAVGFSIEADAIAFRFRIPADLGLSADHPNQRKVRAFRAAYFRHCVQTEPSLDQSANWFQRDWLAQIYLSALVRLAIEAGIGMKEAHHRLHSVDILSSLTIVLETIFQSLELPNGQQQSQRVHDDLLILCRDRNVTDSIGNLARVLWEPPDQQWQQWACNRFKASIGGALLEACVQSCPQMEAGDLYLDIDAGPRPPDAPQLPPDVCEVWVTESTIGGGGIIEEVLRSYAADPRRFFRIAESALAPTDFEIVDREITRLLEMTRTDVDLNNTLNSIRQATNHANLTQATLQLRRTLVQRGFSVTHAVVSAVHSRILRSGSSHQSDALLRRLVGKWNHAEESLGVELDPRVVAFVASVDQVVQADLSSLGAVPANDGYWRFQTIYGLLWPRGSQVRGQGLSFYNPFAPTVIPDRDIVRDLIHCHEPSVQLDPGYAAEVDQGIASHGTVRLVAATTARHALKAAILRISAVPIEVEYLHLFATVVSLTQDGSDVAITLDAREVLP